MGEQCGRAGLSRAAALLYRGVQLVVINKLRVVKLRVIKLQRRERIWLEGRRVVEVAVA
jgi:hypothetical protein